VLLYIRGNIKKHREVKKSVKFQSKNVEYLKGTKVVVIKEQPVKGGGIGCSKNNVSSNTIYEF
jgi:hypothetical protein